MENQQENLENENLTAEEITARKEEMLKFYTDSVLYLKAQHEYEKLLADIDHERLKRSQYAMQYAMMMQQSESQSTEKSVNNESKERKLKKT
jgi:hypothetical protein